MFRRFALLSIAVLVAGVPLHAAENAASIERLKKDLTYLTSDECEGRGAQTKGIHKAADYIAAEFQRLGLKPGGLNNTYFQPFTMKAGRAKMSGVNSITLRGPLGQEVQLKLGGLYAQGAGVPQDFSKAAALFRKAAEQGEKTAQYNLAVLSEQGRGVPKDSNEALKWYQSAARQGHPKAQYWLAYAFNSGGPKRSQAEIPFAQLPGRLADGNRSGRCDRLHARCEVRRVPNWRVFGVRLAGLY